VNVEAKLVELFDRQTAILESLGKDEKTVGTQAGWAGLFGAGGILSPAGIEPDVLTAHVRPTGILERLPRFPSIEESPLFATITGYTDVHGGEPATPCENCPSGYTKSCMLTAAFGRVCRATDTIDWDKTLRRVNRGTFTDLMLRGEILGLTDWKPSALNVSEILNVWTMAEMVQAGVQLERWLNYAVWQGNPANSNVGGGYVEFPGLSRQIATGQVDAITNQACPALDSDVKNFNYNPVCGVNPSIVTYMSMLEFYVRNNAQTMGMEPGSWVWVMTPGLWFELSACWPCQYNTNRCASAVIPTSTVYIEGTEMVAERDRMRQGKTIDVNGTTYPVIVDTGIFEHNNINNANLLAGQYASTIYFVPLRVQGNFPVTYMEHVDYSAGMADIALLNDQHHFWTDKGLYSWTIDPRMWCYELAAKIEPRVVLRTPQLAGRIDSVMYEPLQHLRDPQPDSPYYYDGGVSIRGAPTRYAVWAGGGVVR